MDKLFPLLNNVKEKIRLTEEEEKYFQALWKLKKLKKGQYLLQAGDICRYETFVISGCLKTIYTDRKTGIESILSFALENWWAGDLESFVKQQPSVYDIQAIEHCELLQIDYNDLQELYKNVPQFERYFRLILENYLFSLQKRIVISISQSADERYNSFIKTYPNIIQRVPQYLIASYLGITAEFLSKIRAKQG